ncbi:lipoprotein insertase outer membrane protein LolB [uncultured Hydrogenophaga sp.]|uniref:lipoprotein insertase outer membrane protein LolB n=1 Tax=uncultured Hydrogenophaga sp. TaxID=199683 RepID=UPI00265E2726|nr:lipoprotein insertase outer membrane protein LolB [uncultured Hydrogenophaga sp.]
MNLRLGRTWLPALLLSVVLAGCASAPRLPVDAGGETVWSGRLALKVATARPQSFAAGFELRGSPQAGELLLTSPLGQTLAQVTWSPEGAELRQGDQITRRGSLDQLTTELTGTAVPVQALFDWLRGASTETAGWQADLAAFGDGRIQAQRRNPLPEAELRIIVRP